jgi:hypothetical protein
MSSASRKSDWLIIAGAVVPVLLLAALGVYAGGYLAMGEWAFSLETRIESQKYVELQNYRIYKSRLMACVYYPAARFEGLIRGERYSTLYKPDNDL